VLLRLLVGQGFSVSVDPLLTDLYDGAPPPSALRGLQASVSHVRRTLEPHGAQRAAPAALLTAPPGYALAAAGRRLDADAFAADLPAAKQLAAADPSRAVAHLDAALARWRGERTRRSPSSPGPSRRRCA
jgi:DNA-binding SARP family transcriptional activator